MFSPSFTPDGININTFLWSKLLLSVQSSAFHVHNHKCPLICYFFSPQSHIQLPICYTLHSSQGYQGERWWEDREIKMRQYTESPVCVWEKRTCSTTALVYLYIYHVTLPCLTSSPHMSHALRTGTPLHLGCPQGFPWALHALSSAHVDDHYLSCSQNVILKILDTNSCSIPVS